MLALGTRLRCFSLLLLVVAALAATAGPVAAQATPSNPEATWFGWGLSLSFPNNAMKVKFAVYVGDNNPPGILEKEELVITDDCAVIGDPLTFDGSGYARFNGNSYISCDLPEWHAMVAQMAPHLISGTGPITCECNSSSPAWIAGDLKLDAVTGEQPIFDAGLLDVDMPSVGLPGGTLSTNIRIFGRWAGGYNSAIWTTTSTSANRFLVADEGPLSVATINDFGGLAFLTSPGWRPYFNNNVRNSRAGLWLEPPGMGSWVNVNDSSITMSTAANVATIGYDPTSGAYLRGSISRFNIDPGCRGD